MPFAWFSRIVRRVANPFLPAILREFVALEQACVGEAGEQLRDRGSGDTGASSKLGAGYPLGGDGTQRQELRNGQRGVVAREQPLDPSADERRDRDERVGSLRLGMARRRH